MVIIDKMYLYQTPSGTTNFKDLTWDRGLATQSQFSICHVRQYFILKQIEWPLDNNYVI
jgi:hypothetical protein